MLFLWLSPLNLTNSVIITSLHHLKSAVPLPPLNVHKCFKQINFLYFVDYQMHLHFDILELVMCFQIIGVPSFGDLFFLLGYKRSQFKMVSSQFRMPLALRYLIIDGSLNLLKYTQTDILK